MRRGSGNQSSRSYLKLRIDESFSLWVEINDEETHLETRGREKE